LKQWFATAPRTERDRCKTAFIEQQPFFVFDESPLLVVYTRTRTREIQVLYFTVAADKAAAVDELLQHHSVGPGLQTRPAVRGSRFDQAVPRPGDQVSNASPLSTRFHKYGNVFPDKLHGGANIAINKCAPAEARGAPATLSGCVCLSFSWHGRPGHA